jgi:hypothetical protein
VRALRPPLAAQVELRGGAPAQRRRERPHPALAGLARSGSWWSEAERFAFEHYDVVTSDGTAARLRFDPLRVRWEVDAIYERARPGEAPAQARRHRRGEHERHRDQHEPGERARAGPAPSASAHQSPVATSAPSRPCRSPRASARRR